MKKLTRQEQETIILYNQAEAMAEIYTHDPVLQNKLKNRSEIAKLKCENEFGGQTYVLPKRYLSILKAKRSEKQIQTSRENIRKAFDKRKRLDFETCRVPE